MSFDDAVVCVVNEEYPLAIPQSEGAICDFLTSTNRLFIRMDNITPTERAVYEHGDIACGVLSENGAIMLMWVFFDSLGQPVFIFDTPFESNNIPKEELKLIDRVEEESVILSIYGLLTGRQKSLFT